MRKHLLAALVSSAYIACGGSGTTHRVEEVPIDNSVKRPTDLPPDEVASSGSAAALSSSALPDRGPPPGVGPQPLDTGDAGAATTHADGGRPTAVFVAHSGGLSEKDCSDLVMKFAKLATDEEGVATPAAADLPQHPVYGPMLVDCGNNATKKQQKCATRAHTSAAWAKCMK